MEAVIALLIPLIPISVAGVWLFGRTALGRAVVARIEGRAPRDGDQLEAIHDELDLLPELVQLLRDEQQEAMERLDFTERLLARPPDNDAMR